MNDITQLARRVFANDLFATKATGVAIDEAEAGEAVCTLALGPMQRNAKGAVMGGAIFTLADFATAVAANSHLLASASQPEEVTLKWVTSSANINFLNSAQGDKLEASAKVIKQGRRQTVVSVSVSDNTGRLIAIVTASANNISE